LGATSKYHDVAKVVLYNRQKQFSGSLRSFYDSRSDLPIDYQSWSHIENGRRLPRPDKAIEIADVLHIPHQSMLEAYMRDLFGKTRARLQSDPTPAVLNAQDCQLLCEVREIDKKDSVATPQQVAFMCNNPRSFAVLAHNYVNGSTRLDRLASQLGLSIPVAEGLINGLHQVGLLRYESVSGIIYEVHSGIRISSGSASLETRKEIFSKSIHEFLTERSFVSCMTLQLSPSSALELRSRIQIIEALAIKMNEDDRAKDDSNLYHVLASLSPYK
jgi:hypothetical protein